jgi:hypothetical protein
MATKILDRFDYLDFKYKTVEIKCRHKISGVEYLAYQIQPYDEDCVCGICGFRILGGG